MNSNQGGTMKRCHLLFISVIAAGLVGFAAISASSGQPSKDRPRGMRGSQDESGVAWSYCPYCGGRLYHNDERRFGHGPHHDRWGSGYYGMGPGMMGPGNRHGHDDGEKPRVFREREPLKKQEAQRIVKNMLVMSRNPNLKVGDVKDKNSFYLVEVLTMNGSLVDKIMVDKNTGLMRSEY